MIMRRLIVLAAVLLCSCSIVAGCTGIKGWNSMEVDKAARAYSEALLSGNARAVWEMRTPEAQSREPYAEFAARVEATAKEHGDAKMTSLEVDAGNDDEAFAICTYDEPELNETQWWVKHGQAWLVDN
jgi:hypothetical protein